MKNTLFKKENGKSFFNAQPNEKIILITRSHWTSLFFPIALVSGATLTLLILYSIAYIYISFSLLLLFSLAALTLVTASLLITQRVIEWYFHMYIISNRKIMEIFHSPLIFGKVTEILLNQVRCTEVDSEMNGIIDHFFDIGNVTITFDRPTHEKEFVLKRIRRPNLVCMHLTSFLIAQQKPTSNRDFWVENNLNSNKVYIEDFQN